MEWRKKEIQRVAKQEADRQLLEKMIEIYEPSREEISEIYKLIMYIIRAKAVSWAQSIQKDENGKISFSQDIKLSEVKLIWEMIRTEMKLPVKYTQLRNDIHIKIEKDEEDVIFYKI